MNEPILKSAKDSYEYSRLAREKKMKDELSLIAEYISQAICDGEFSCSVYEHISKETIQRLRDMGYEVYDNCNQWNGTDYTIKWDTKEVNK